MLRLAIIMVIIQEISFVHVIFEVLYQLDTVIDRTKNTPDQYYSSEFNVEIPSLFLCFILFRPMWLNKHSVSVLPWGITRMAFTSFANVV